MNAQHYSMAPMQYRVDFQSPKFSATAAKFVMIQWRRQSISHLVACRIYYTTLLDRH